MSEEPNLDLKVSPDVYKGILKGKKGVILGVANKWSIAWGITNACHLAEAELILTYQERVQERVDKLASELSGIRTIECDVTDDDSLDRAFAQISEIFGGQLDFVVHSVAFAKKENLVGRYVDTPREDYALAQDVSAYSLAAVAKRAEPLLEASGGGSIITMTYLGGERVVQNYNVMGVAKAALESSVKYLANDLGPKNIRVNAISAGPIKTLAASAIGGIGGIIDSMAGVAPLRRNVDPTDVGDTALFLVSDLARGITGELIHVDSGFHAIAAVN